MENAKDYHTSNNVQRSAILSLIEEFSDNLMNICGKCMDIGCGPGDTTKDLLLPALGSNAQIIGTDISENMIKYANKTINDEKRLQFEVLDIETKNLPTKYISEFDHIFSFHTLHWCNDIRQVCKNMYQMLRPNGTILLYFIASHEMFEILRTLAQDVRFTQYIPDKIKIISSYQESNPNPRKALKELLQSIGFTVHHCSLREGSFTDEKRFLKSIISVLTFLEDMPQHVKEEYEKKLIYEYKNYNKIRYTSVICNNQKITLGQYTGLVVHAQKM